MQETRMVRAKKRTLTAMQNAVTKDKAQSKKIVGKVSQFALKRAEAAENAVEAVESSAKKQRLESKVRTEHANSFRPVQAVLT